MGKMKKKIFISVLLTLLSVKVFPQSMTLDNAIKEVADRIIEQIILRNIPEVFDFTSNTIKVAILDFDCSSKALSQYIVSDLTKYFLRNMKLVLVDRQNLDRARKELKFNMSSEVDDNTAQSIGKFVGAQVVIFGSVKPFGKMYRMEARAITVEKGIILAQENVNIREKDIKPFITKTSPPKSSWNNITNSANRNYLEIISGDVQFSDDLIGGGGSFLVGGHVSPFPFFSLGLETKFGSFNNEFYGSASPMAGLVLPFNNTIKLYGDGILELGYFGSLNGLINNWVTPAFDTGMLFWFDGLGFDIKYRGTWYKDTYTHSIGVGFISRPEIFFEGAGNVFYDIGRFLSDVIPWVCVVVGVPALVAGPFINGAAPSGSSQELAGSIIMYSGVALTTIGVTILILR